MTDERVLGEWLERVRSGSLSRRDFTRALLALGLTPPLITDLLRSRGIAEAQPKRGPFTPSRRGGGGDLKMLWWQAPTILNPHLAIGVKDGDGSRLFYEPLVSFDPEGNMVPVLASEVPTVQNGMVARDGLSVTVKLKKGVQWHDGKPFTADDVVFTWEYAADPATLAVSTGSYREIARIDKPDAHTVKIVYKTPTPFWATAFRGVIPRHVFEPFKGARSREAPANLKPVGTGPYRLIDFKPGDIVRAEIFPAYHEPNWPFFDRLEMKGGGDAVSAARAVMQTGEYDFAWNMQVEDDLLQRMEQGGKGKVEIAWGGQVEHILCNFSDPWREVDGEWSSLKAPHPVLTEQPVRSALSLTVDRTSIQEHLVGRTGQITANFLNAPDRFRSHNSTWEFNIEKANDVLEQAGYLRGPDGVRAKDTRRLRLLFQAAANSTVQKIQTVIKQGAARAGIEMEVKAIPASVFFASDVSNVDTNVRFHADLQTYTVFTGLDPQLFMAQFASWEIPTKENGWNGRNIARWRSADFDRLWRKAENEMDPVKRAALFIKMNDMVVQSAVVIPVTWRNVLHAAANSLAGIEPNSWDSIFGRIAYWYRLG